MRFSRFLTLLASVALLAGSAAVVAPATAAETLSTTVVIELEKNRLRYNDTFDIEGQVQTTYQGEQLGVESAEVVLQRQFPGRGWVAVGNQTGNGWDGKFTFYGVPAKQNAAYRVVYAGETRDYDGAQLAFTPSTSAAKGIRVLRDFKLDSRRQNGGMVLLGRVVPTYKNRVVQVLQRKCERCRWTAFTKVRTNKRSRFSVRVALPPRVGPTWDYRVKTPADKAFLASPSRQYLYVYRY